MYVEDVARAFENLLQEESSVGEAYNVAAEEIFSLKDYLIALAGLLGIEPTLVHVPQEDFDGLEISNHPHGDVFPFNTRRTAIFSLDKIKHDLDYRSTPFAEWMPKTINWFVNSYGGDSVGYERRNEELQIIERLNLKR